MTIFPAHPLSGTIQGPKLVMPEIKTGGSPSKRRLATSAGTPLRLMLAARVSLVLPRKKHHGCGFRRRVVGRLGASWPRPSASSLGSGPIGSLSGLVGSGGR